MTSLRQKPKLSLETPVLFRLPDLRVHPSHAVSAWPHAHLPESLGVTAVTDAQSLRIDPSPSVTSAANHVPPANNAPVPLAAISSLPHKQLRPTEVVPRK